MPAGGRYRGCRVAVAVSSVQVGAALNQQHDHIHITGSRGFHQRRPPAEVDVLDGGTMVEKLLGQRQRSALDRQNEGC